jgi:hypothetical protein
VAAPEATAISVAVSGLNKEPSIKYRVLSADRAGNRSTSAVVSFTAR